MLGHLAEPLDDELLWSCLARTRRQLGATQSQFRHAAFGGAWPASTQMPSGVARLGAPLTSRSVGELIRAHTAWPYHALWMRPERAVALRDWIGFGRPSPGRRPVPETLTPPIPVALRTCALCARCDLAAHGHTGWRRSHQLPGVWVCPDHLEPLREAGVPSAHPGAIVECRPWGSFPAFCPFDRPAAVRLAVLTSRLLGHAGAAPPLAASRAEFRSMMDRRGWILADGRTNGHFWRAFQTRFGAAALYAAGVDLGNARSVRALQRLWGGSGDDGWPALLPVLLLDFLEADPSEFLAAAFSRACEETAGSYPIPLTAFSAGRSPEGSRPEIAARNALAGGS